MELSGWTAVDLGKMDEATRRRYAITVVDELPASLDDAIAVLALARKLVLWANLHEIQNAADGAVISAENLFG